MSTFGAELACYPSATKQLFEVVAPYLTFHLAILGVRTLVDCTAAYFGLHPEILRKFAPGLAGCTS